MTLYLFLLILFINSSVSIINQVETQVSDSFSISPITFSLANYNVFNPDGESIESVYKLPHNSIHKIVVTNISSDVHFVLVQTHSYLVNVTLSYDKTPVLKNSISGTNVGLIKMNEKSDIVFYLLINNNTSTSEDVDVMIAVQAYGINAPIPGGCNMELQVEISPFLQTVFNNEITEVDFAPASPPPLPALHKLETYPNDECNIKPSPIRHFMYYQYFPEGDFSVDTYFKVLKSMMTKSRIIESANLVKEKSIGFPMRKMFASYPGTGNAFVVISHFKNHTAVYVPSFTYACNISNENNTCLPLITTFSKLVCASILFMGLFACFIGHFFFKTEIFLLGYLVSGIVSYILVSLLFTNSIAFSTATASGFFFACSMLIAWCFFGIPIISVTLATLTMGFLTASVLFYFITDYVDLFALDINYWGIFIGIVVTFPILMFYLAETANITACAFVGSYVAIISVDHYIGSNLRYIVLNTIRRAIQEKFYLTTIGPPFQIKDLILCLCWGLLFLLGIKTQKRLMRNRPPYPPPVNPLKKLFERVRGPPVPEREPSEISPLLPGKMHGAYVSLLNPNIDLRNENNLRL